MRTTLLLLFILALTSCATSKEKVLTYDSQLENFSYPYPAKHFKFKSQQQDLEMAYMDVSPANPKDVYVLFHGKNFSGYYFKDFIDFFVSNQYRVIVIDQIGFGKSSKPKSYQFSFQTLSDNTQKLLSSLGVKNYRLLGHSMGGMLAIRHALSYPAEVKSLALINPIGLEDWKTMTSYKSVDELYKAELGNTLEKAREYQKASYYDGKWEAKYDDLLIPLKGWLNGEDKDVIAWNAALTSEMIFTQPVIYEVKNLKMPILLINGTRDRTAIGRAWAPIENQKRMGQYQELGKKFKALNSRVKLIELPGLGHMPFYENQNMFWKKSSGPLLFK